MGVLIHSPILVVISSFVYTFTWVLMLLCLLFCSNSKAYANIQGGGERETRENYYLVKMRSISSILDYQATDCSSSHISNAQGDFSDTSTLKIFHKYGHCSKSHHHLNQLSPQEKLTKSLDEALDDDQFFIQEQLRVNSIQSKVSKNKNSNQFLQSHNSKASSIPTYSGLPLGTGNYYVSIGFGTPKRDLSLIFDTGSDFTWIQCSPCVVFCHQQKEPVFDPTQSTTYSNITCNSTECSELRSATSTSPRCSSSTCIYGIQYGDRSYSVGFFGSEKITLTSKDVFPKFLFGCGENNNGLYGRTAGLLGLGRNKLSFVVQTAKKYGQLFSYCLPSTLNSTGHLTFGKDKLKSKTRYTPLLTDSSGPSFYFLDMISISVGGTKLSIPTSVFKSSGTIIDSGTVITRLPPSAYSQLRSTFRSFMSEYNLTQPTRLLDTCYNLSSYDEVSVPKITLYFKGGAELDVGFSGILLGAPSQSCLAFAGNQNDTDVAILGNRQQETFKVVYDVARKRLGFIPKGCN